MDLVVVNEKQAVLEVNFEEVKATLENKLADYKGLVVTEDTLSVAKASQKELAGLRTEIERFRKDKKADMEAPIKAFESKCKDLLALVEEVEKPLKDAINVFDDQTREEKRQIATDIISDVALKYCLNDKFAAQLTIDPKYLNLTATKKAVTDDVTTRAIALQALQMAEESKLTAIKAVIDSENNRLTAKMDISEYQPLIDRGAELSEIMAQIKARAERVYAAENAPKEETKEEPKKEQPAPDPEDTRDYFLSVKLVGKKDAIQIISKAIKDSGIAYTVLEQGVI